MKLPNSQQMHELDRVTMEKQGISSLNLMERAANKLAEYIDTHVNKHSCDKERRVVIFCGSGNNGGDGLAIARLLWQKGWNEIVCCELRCFHKYSDDNIQNYNRLKQISGINVIDISDEKDIPQLVGTDIVLDCLFGTGLNRAISGLSATVIEHINRSNAEVIAIDIPSGLSDYSCNPDGAVVHAVRTLTIQAPTVSMLWPENYGIVGDFEIVDINLDQSSLENTDTPYNLVTNDGIAKMLKPRPKFAHKGTFGHALLISGAYGKAGAAVMASKACHRTGCGLVTTHIPKKLVDIIQISTPETMVSIDDNEDIISILPDITKYSSIGIGPGIGTDEITANAVRQLITTAECPLVLDADALNIIAKFQMIDLVPENSVLTPHPKEFERLFGKTKNSYERLNVLRDNAVKHKLVILLKGAHTAVATPDGNVYFNTTGNPGMATAGSGDVLTGIITSLLSQKYNAEEAAILGVYIHGLAGDIAAEKSGTQGIIATDIIENVPLAIKRIR